MKFYYQVLSTPTADTPGTAIILHFPDKRYFFGQISEGTQRACTERGVRLSYLTDIFLTGRTEWANNGGLIGVILTLADALASSASAQELVAREKEARGHGAQLDKLQSQQQDGQADRGTLTIHGGRNLTHTLATARRFVFRKGMPVFTREYDSESLSKSGSQPHAADPFEQPTWSDSNIKVWAMPIRPSPSQQSRRTSPQAGPQSPRKRSLDEFQEHNADKPVLDQRAQDHIMRQSVISDMFNSSWRMDALVETPLADVKMPAVMFIRDSQTKDLKPYQPPPPGSEEALPDKVLVRQPWPGASVEKLPSTTRYHEAVSYIVRNHDIRGRFDPGKAKELKVRYGPNFAALTRGENVLSEDGKTVTPDMVLGPPRLGKGLAIIDLPTPDYVDDLVDRPEWNLPAVTTGLEAFLWILGPGVGDHPRLREFVARMSHCKHTVSSTDYCPNYLALPSVAGSSIRLARLRGENYPVPVHDNKTLPQPGTPTSESETTKEMIRNSPFEPIKPGLIIDMEPKFELNRSEVLPLFNPAMTVQKIPHSIEQRVTAIRRRVMKPEFQEKLAEFRKDLPGADVEIVTLGTGSSAPSKYRNVSSTLVNVPGVGSYLLDCGENTIGQLKRMYEPKKLQEVLQNLRLIWISHLHADHHLGTASVIKEWFRANYPHGVPPDTGGVETDISKILQDKRLFVVSEEGMIGWLEEYAGVEDYGFGKLVPLAARSTHVDGDIKTEFSYRHCRDDGSYPGSGVEGSRPQTTTLRFDDDSSPETALLRQATGLADILTTRVTHCRGAMAVSLVFPDGFKLSFSGDCRPSNNFAAIGRDSTVLIHEATFQDDMAVSAVAKKHSTTSEALEVGRQMQARTIILTHFSQRYQKIAHVESAKSDPQPAPTPGPMARENQVPDVPDDDPVPEPEPSTIPTPGPPETETETENNPVLQAPVTAAFDYMRIRVGDIPIAQAFAPAIEKLFDILERASVVEANKQKKLREAAEALAKEKKKQKHKKKAAAEPEPAPEPASEATPAAAPAPGEAIDGEEGPSLWSASESESEWGESDDEWMDRFWRGKQIGNPGRSRSRSWSGRRSSPTIRARRARVP
jgi:ribonuclease Z